MTHISTSSNSEPLYEYIIPYIISLEELSKHTDGELHNDGELHKDGNLHKDGDLHTDGDLHKDDDLHKLAKVYINGAWLGNVIDPIKLYNLLKEKKHKGIINIYTSIVFDCLDLL